MNATEIIAAINAQDDALPKEALIEAMDHPEKVTGLLLKLVADLARDPAKILDPEDNSMGHLIALYLLAQFREARTLPLLVEVLKLGGDDLDRLFGDVLVMDMARILASVSRGETGPIRGLIENPEVDLRARRVALHSLFCLVYSDVVERGPVVEYLGELFGGKLDRRPSRVWTELVRTASWLGPEELYDEIRKAHEEGLLTGKNVDFLLEEVDENRVWGLESGAPRLADTAVHFLIGSTLEEIGGGAWFSAETRLGPADFY